MTDEERELSMLYSNHSCEPNLGLRGEITFVAMRDIRAGAEELTRPSEIRYHDLLGAADIGNKLKIATGKLQAQNYKAELGRARQTGNFVTIPFRIAGSRVSGINLYRQGKSEKSPQKIGFFFRTPAIDTSPGKGELSYTARPVLDGKEIGKASDAVTVKVS